MSTDRAAGAAMLAQSTKTTAKRAPGLVEAGPELALPSGFSYHTFGAFGSAMSDGFITPPIHDGMAAFDMGGGRIRIVRNHELGEGNDIEAGTTELISLTPLEFDLLVALARKPRQVFTREVLLEQVWGYRHAADTRLVNVHVQRLRAKVETDPENPEVVLTVRGVGYKAGPP